MKRTGMRLVSPALSICSVKQKHSVLLKYSEAEFGATLGTALPTMSRAEMLVASNQASLSWPGCTCMLTFSALNAQGSVDFVLATNCTVTRRDSSTVIAAAASASTAPCSSLMPSTCSQAMLYSGISAKPNAKKPPAMSQPFFCQMRLAALTSPSPYYSSAARHARRNPHRSARSRPR
jgi:hypothetical protein